MDGIIQRFICEDCFWQSESNGGVDVKPAFDFSVNGMDVGVRGITEQFGELRHELEFDKCDSVELEDT